ncbi:hypothetical protein GCM10028791_24010 [Echinicola sediminis]
MHRPNEQGAFLGVGDWKLIQRDLECNIQPRISFIRIQAISAGWEKSHKLKFEVHHPYSDAGWLGNYEKHLMEYRRLSNVLCLSSNIYKK